MGITIRVTADASARYYPGTSPLSIRDFFGRPSTGRLPESMTDHDKSDNDTARQLDVEELVALLRRTADGDRTAFAALYQATHRKLFGIVLRIMKRQTLAEEVLQEVYIRIWKHADTYASGKSSPITWMAVIARNCALDEVRRKSPDTGSDDDDVINNFPDLPQSGPGRQTEMGQDLRRLQDCISQVGGDQADMVRLAYLDGLSRQALADRFSQPVGTIKVWLHRSLKQIKSCLGGLPA